MSADRLSYIRLTCYSASLVPSDATGRSLFYDEALSSDEAFSRYWDEIQERVQDVLRSLGVKNPPAKIPPRAGARLYRGEGFTGNGDMYALGTFFHNRETPANDPNNPSMWGAQYDLAVCSYFDEELIKVLRGKMELPMQNVRNNGMSEILFPIIGDGGLLVAHSQYAQRILERELIGPDLPELMRVADLSQLLRTLSVATS